MAKEATAVEDDPKHVNHRDWISLFSPWKHFWCRVRVSGLQIWIPREVLNHMGSYVICFKFLLLNRNYFISFYFGYLICFSLNYLKT